MNLLILPSLIALGIKVWLFSVSRLALFRDNPHLAFFLCALFGLNLAELSLFLMKNDPAGASPVIMSYYAAAIFSAAAYLILAIWVIWHTKFITNLLVASALIMSALVFIPDFFISGAQSIGYSITRIPGEYYIWLQIYLIAFMMLAIAISVYGIIAGKNKRVQKRSLIVLIATSPMAVAATLIILIMIMGYQVNATVILSLLTSLTLVILIYAEKQYRMFKFLSYVPYTEENRIRNQISLLVNETIDSLFLNEETLDFKDISAKFEAAVIDMAIQATNGNKTQAAKLLQIGKATLHRKIAKI